MKNSINDKYIEKIKNEYNELIYSYLRNDKEYQKILSKVDKILCDFPRVKKVYKNNAKIALTKKECAMLIKLRRYYEEIDIIRGKKLLFSGFRIAHLMFINSDMLKK